LFRQNIPPYTPGSTVFGATSILSQYGNYDNIFYIYDAFLLKRKRSVKNR
jgi:hypothetical protein